MMRTACIRLNVTPEQTARLSALRTAYADGCNRLVPLVQAARCWNRVALHQLGYRPLRQQTSLGAQMACNAIFSVCKAYRAQRALGRIPQDTPVPPLSFDRTSVHFDHRTYTLKGEAVSLNTLQGRMLVPMILGDHQRRILASGLPKEAELVFRRGQWFLNLVVASADGESVTSGPVMGVDVGENTLAAASTGRIWGGETLRHRRDQHLALRRRLQSNGSQSATQRLRQVSGKERRRVKHVNHEQGDSRGSPTHWRGHDRDGGSHAHPRSPSGRPAHARKTAPLGIPAVAELCRVQGPCRWDLRRVCRSGLHEPELFGLRAVGYTAQASFRVFLWSPGAR